MMSRVTIRGLLFSCTALLALGVAGCASLSEESAPERERTGGTGTEQVGEVVEGFNLAGPSTREGDAAGRGGVDEDKKGYTDDSRDLLLPGHDRTEPDPVPWVPRYLMANDA